MTAKYRIRALAQADLVFYIVVNHQVEIIGIPHQGMDVVEYLA